jgi:hypothetical protein
MDICVQIDFGKNIFYFSCFIFGLTKILCKNNFYSYGVLSTFDQTWFLKRGIRKDQGWLQVSDVVTNTSTDPTLLKSIAYIIFIASNNGYSPFIERAEKVLTI